MTLILSGTDGLSDVDGTAATPAIRGTDTNTGIYFPAADTIAFSEGGVESMRLDSSGNLGIGTSSPGQRLEVSNSSTNTTFSTVGNQLLIRNSGSTANAFARIDFTGSTNNPMASIAAQFENYGTGATSIIFGNTNTGTGAITERARISSSGIFRIGSLVTNTSGSAANVVCDNATGDLYRSTSSRKYKNDIQDAWYGLTNLMQLRPVTYKSKSITDGDKVFGGLIAEEVHEAGLTEFVQYAEDGSPDALAYSNMVSLCIKAIQEQQTLIQSLTARIEALEGK